MQELKCKNCGAPLNDSTMKCEYCGTSYVKEDKDELQKIDRIVKSKHILTPNEARQAIGLYAIPEVIEYFEKSEVDIYGKKYD